MTQLTHQARIHAKVTFKSSTLPAVAVAPKVRGVLVSVAPWHLAALEVRFSSFGVSLDHHKHILNVDIRISSALAKFPQSHRIRRSGRRTSCLLSYPLALILSKLTLLKLRFCTETLGRLNWEKSMARMRLVQY